MERTLIILKPDVLSRKLAGEIISRFERKNLDILDVKLEIISREAALEHYNHVKDLSFFKDMIDYMTGSPSLIMILGGEKAIGVVRGMIGNTKTFEALPGTIRGDYGLHTFKNLIHASDCIENAEIEIKRFFPELGQNK